MAVESISKLIKNNNTSQCRFRFCRVWRNPDVGNFTSIGSPAHKEVDSKRPTKQNFVKHFMEKCFCENILWSEIKEKQ